MCSRGGPRHDAVDRRVALEGPFPRPRRLHLARAVRWRRHGAGEEGRGLQSQELRRALDHDRHEWFPLKPGTRLVYAGTTIEDDGKAVPRRLVSIVTDLTKVIGGVRTVVVWDVDYKDGQLAETEIAFFAQDNDGNVWLLGEYPEEWEGGKFLKAPVWLHGREEARAGIAMKAKPQVGTPSYAQARGPAA